MLKQERASCRDEDEHRGDVRYRGMGKKELQEPRPRRRARFGCRCPQLGLEQGAWAGRGGQLWIERSAMRVNEMGDRGFQFSQARAAQPAAGQMCANLAGAACGKFTVR